MHESSSPTRCPGGHDDTVKLLSTVAVGGRSGASGGVERAAGPGAGGGCCGGACGCG